MHCLYHPVILECVLKSEYYFQLSNSPERLPQNFYQIESFLPIQALAICSQNLFKYGKIGIEKYINNPAKPILPGF